MKQIKQCIALIAIVLFSSVLYAQVKIIDLSVMPLVQANGVSNPDTTELMIGFKINNINEAQSLHIDFGTTQLSNNILAVSGTFAGNDINIAGKSYNVTNYQAHVNISLTTQQYNALHYITLYVSDNTGNNTDKLEFVK